MSERSGGELLEERSCKSRRLSERSQISQRSERSGTSERTGISQRSQISEKSQLSEASGKSYKTEDKLAAFSCSVNSCSVNSESKTEVDMHPLREVRTSVFPLSSQNHHHKICDKYMTKMWRIYDKYITNM